MFDWFDLMRDAQAKAAAAMLGQHFHLKDSQTNAAMAAFLPAFAMGMQHAMASNPSATPLDSLFGGAGQNPWLNAAQAFTPGSKRNGQQILDRIFGSDDVSRQVARQAAEMAGINTDVMQQMLPVLAGLYAGGMYHWMSGQGRGIGAGSPSAPSSHDLAESWSRFFTVWTGQDKPPERRETPFDVMMASFVKPPSASQKPAVPKRPSAEEKDAAKSGAPPTPPAWEDMMEKGREMQTQYLESLQSIFEDAQKTRTRKP